MAHGTSRRSFLLLGGAAIASALAGCGSDGTATWQGGSAGASGAPSGTPSSKPTAASGKPVHVSLLNGDGDVRGVGMPIIAFFNVAPTDVKAFNAATKVTVNGPPVEGNWFFEETAHRGCRDGGALAATELLAGARQDPHGSAGEGPVRRATAWSSTTA